MKKIFLLLFIFIIITISHSQEKDSLESGASRESFQENKEAKSQEIKSQKKKGFILKYTLIPTTIKTGEKGFIRIKLADNLASLDTKTISIKNNQWFHIDDIKINHDEDEILIWYIPLDSTISSFPDFSIGDRIYSGIPLSVKSRLGNLNKINQLGDKLLLPWTKLLFAAGFALLVLVLFLFYYLIKIVPQKIRKKIILNSNSFKRKQLLKKMSKMASRLNHLNNANQSNQSSSSSLSRSNQSNRKEKTDYIEYIKRFIKLLKNYLEIASGKNATCFTAKEIAATFPEAPLKELIFMDSVRFGNVNTDSKIVAEASGVVYAFALKFEEITGEKT